MSPRLHIRVLTRDRRDRRRGNGTPAPIPPIALTGAVPRLQPVHLPRFPRLARALRLGDRRHRLAAAAPRRRGRGAARASASRPAISSRTRAANTCSTTAGPRPMSAPAAAIIRSCRSSVPFTPATGRRLLTRPGTRTDEARTGAGARPGGTDAAAAAPPRCTSPSCPSRNGVASAAARIPAAHRPAIPLGECRLRDLRRFPRPSSRRASARSSSASGATRLRTASRSSGSPART